MWEKATYGKENDLTTLLYLAIIARYNSMLLVLHKHVANKHSTSSVLWLYPSLQAFPKAPSPAYQRERGRQTDRQTETETDRDTQRDRESMLTAIVQIQKKNTKKYNSLETESGRVLISHDKAVFKSLWRFSFVKAAHIFCRGDDIKRRRNLIKCVY